MGLLRNKPAIENLTNTTYLKEKMHLNISKRCTSVVDVIHRARDTDAPKGWRGSDSMAIPTFIHYARRHSICRSEPDPPFAIGVHDGGKLRHACKVWHPTIQMQIKLHPTNAIGREWFCTYLLFGVLP